MNIGQCSYRNCIGLAIIFYREVFPKTDDHFISALYNTYTKFVFGRCKHHELHGASKAIVSVITEEEYLIQCVMEV